MSGDKFNTPKGETFSFDDRLRLCRKLTPKILNATDDFFNPNKIHPYLEALADGGTITSHPDRDTEDSEYYTIVEARGHRDTLNPESLEVIGIPKDIVANGLMWSLLTREAEFEKGTKMPRELSSTTTGSAFAFWDGSQWSVKRQDLEADTKDPWETKWSASELTDEELSAIKVVTSQTQDIQSIAEVFEGDTHAFRNMFSELLEREHGVAEPERDQITTFALGSTIHYENLPAYMRVFATGYQSAKGSLIDTAYKLSRGNSRRLDSRGIMDASYYAPSVPFTSDMVENGVYIPQRYIHPPVPVGFIN